MVRCKLIVPVLLLISLLALPSVLSQEQCLYYFYGRDCEECIPATAYLTNLQTSNLELKIEQLESYHHRQNAQLLDKYFLAYQVPAESQGLPAVFLAGTYLIGSKPILELTEGVIKDNPELPCPGLDALEAVGVVGESGPSNVLGTLSLGKIISSALKHSFSPVMLSLLVLVLFFLTAKKNQAVNRGIYFISTIFTIYILFGLGLFGFILPADALPIIFYKLIAIVVIAFAGWRIITFLHPKIFSLEHIQQMESFLERNLSSIPAVIFTGIISAILTLAGSSEIFLLLREIYMEAHFRGAVISLNLFNLILSMWLLIGAVIIYWFITIRAGKNKVENNKQSNKKVRTLNPQLAENKKAALTPSTAEALDQLEEAMIPTPKKEN